MAKNRDRTERLAFIFHTLANPNRLAIFEAIREVSRGGPVECLDDARACVGAIGGRFQIAPSTLSEHLKELKRAGLITMTRKGRMVYCCASVDALEDLKAFSAS